MADPIKLRIAYAIRARLQTILTASGFNTNAGQRVTIGRQTIDAESELPCITIREGETEAWANAGKGARALATGGSEKVEKNTAWNIDGYVSATQATNGTQQMLVAADIEKAMMLGTDLYESGLRLGPIGLLGSEPFTREDGADGEGIRVKFSTHYTEKYGDPYATASQQ